jgi:alpha-L-rhamnosidase
MKIFNVHNLSRSILFFSIIVCISSCIDNSKDEVTITDEITQLDYSGDIERNYISPKKIIWTSDSTGNYVNGAERLLEKGTGQPILGQDKFCALKSDQNNTASILLDFGKELHGGLQIVTGQYKKNKPVNIRVRFGESVAEAMAELGNTTNSNATNDHAIRDWEIQVPWLGKTEIGNTGFRFVRIDVLDKDIELYLKEVNAISVIRDIPYLGSFKSNDERLNEIWQTGAYTVHLNMQEYLWDGVKRDRLVWVGDMHPEVSTINAVFGNSPIVPKTLDLAKDITPPSEWMNGISSYSLWWIIIQYEWYMAHGDLEYLKKQETYLSELTDNLLKYIDDKNGEVLNGNRFLDWPTKGDDEAVHAGLNALFSIAMDKSAKIGDYLGNQVLKNKAIQAKAKLDAYKPNPVNNKQANALAILSGLHSEDNLNKITAGGVEGISAFYGYYVLEALAESGQTDLALSIINDFWGGMLDMGATTFWEEFELSEKEISGRIDKLPSDDLKNYHAETGDHCYIGYRRSLCHGWASGPTPWLSKYVLGIKILEPGAKKVQIKPNLGNLNWVEGTYPTPYGLIKVRHEKLPSGEIKSDIDLPEGIELVE